MADLIGGYEKVKIVRPTVKVWNSMGYRRVAQRDGGKNPCFVRDFDLPKTWPHDRVTGDRRPTDVAGKLLQIYRRFTLKGVINW